MGRAQCPIEFPVPVPADMGLITFAFPDLRPVQALFGCPVVEEFLLNLPLIGLA